MQITPPRISTRPPTPTLPSDLVPELPILYHDSDFIIVNKPAEMLSVPGKISLPPTRLPRHEEWINSIHEAARTYNKEIVKHDEYSSDCETVLRALCKYNSFARKEIPFKFFIRKTLRIDDERLLDKVWRVVVKKDSELHRIPLSTIPSNYISAAEIVDAKYGKIYHIHRLDMSTSGILLFARSEYACNEFSKLFRDRNISKKYIAEVFGRVIDEEFQVDVPIRGDINNRPRQVVDLVNGKHSVTMGRVLERREKVVNGNTVETTIVELCPLTGRTHQLRVHMAHIGFPILGDDLYACQTAIAVSDGRLHLHAGQLDFEHPFSDKIFSVSTACAFFDGYVDSLIVANATKKRKLSAGSVEKDRSDTVIGNSDIE